MQLLKTPFKSLFLNDIFTLVKVSNIFYIQKKCIIKQTHERITKNMKITFVKRFI
jgi:hypothetical protein